MLKITNSQKVQYALLETLVANECQLHVAFENGIKVLIFFERGIWSVGKTTDYHEGKQHALDGYFMFGDGLEVIECEDEVLRALLKSRVEANRFLHDQLREAPARSIVDVLPAWTKCKTISQIDILQPNRNGRLTKDGFIVMGTY